jgi:hypothetical protein
MTEGKAALELPWNNEHLSPCEESIFSSHPHRCWGAREKLTGEKDGWVINPRRVDATHCESAGQDSFFPGPGSLAASAPLTGAGLWQSQNEMNALACTFSVVPHPNKNSGTRCPQVHRRDAALNPRACGPCGQRLSARLVGLLSSSFNSAARWERPALAALRVASEGPAPLVARPVGSCAPRAPVQG